MSRQVFKVPVEWKVFATMEVEAETLEEAIEMIYRDKDHEGHSLELPTDTEYIEGSLRVMEEYSIEDMEELWN